MTKPHNDFEVAKSMHDLLEPLNGDRRQRILRWVSESLGISTVTSNTATQSGAPASAPPFADSATRSPASTSIDIKSFVESKSPNSDVQFAAVVAYYYRFEAPPEKKSDSISSELLQDATRLVGRNRLTNANATLNNAKTLGYLDSPTAGAFELNTVGENLVAMTLPSGSGDTKPKRKSAKKKSTKKKSGKRKSGKKK